MRKVLVRHGRSQANYPYEIGINNRLATLLEEGKQQSRGLTTNLGKLGIRTDQRVATSTFIRAKQTAWVAGFDYASAYPILDEAVDRPLTGQERDDIKLRRIIPKEALVSADMILLSPPSEEVWITHALVIAGICQRLDVYSDVSAIARFCETRIINI